MPIHRHRTETNFTILPNELLRDPALSCRDRGLLVYLLSLPPDWDVSINGLAAMLPDGRGFVTASLKRLREVGYVIKQTIRDEEGKIRGTDWHVFDSTAAASASIYAALFADAEPYPEKPYPEKPDTDKPDTENRTQTKNRLNKGQTEQRNRKSRPRDFQEVEAYFASLNASELEARKWLDRQEAGGWLYGKGHIPVVDWRASARTWISNIDAFKPKRGTNGQADRRTAAERSNQLTLAGVADRANKALALLDDYDRQG